MSGQIIWFKDCSYENKHLVGGKCSSLGELHAISRRIGFSIGDGFAITTEMYDDFVENNDLGPKIEKMLATINTENIKELEEKTKELRDVICGASLTESQIAAISIGYYDMCKFIIVKV